MYKKIKSFPDACERLGMNVNLPDVSMINDRDGRALVANYRMGVIARALNLDEETNKEWEPDWNDHTQYKWTPWFTASGSGLSFSAADYWRSFTGVGSRLCYRTEAICEYAAEQFIDLYRELLS